MSHGNEVRRRVHLTTRILSRALVLLLAIAVMSSSVLTPLAEAAAIAQPPVSETARSSVLTTPVSPAEIPALAGRVAQSILPVPPTEESRPQAVVPDASLKKETVRRTEFTRTERNPDGSYSTTFSPRPLHFKDAQTSVWKPFDDRLRPATAPGYTHENTANGFKASFDQPSDVAAGRPVMRFATEAGAVTMIAVGARPSRSNVSGPRISYPDAYPGVDLQYTVDGDRVKEDIRLASAPANSLAATFVYDLVLEDVTAAKQADNSIVFKDASGKLAFRMPRPFMVDGNIRGPEKGYSDDVQVTLTRLAEGKLRLELAPDLAWLQAPERVYPVSIDPTIQRVPYGPTGAAAQNTSVYEADPTRVDGGLNSVLHTGKNAAGQRRDTLIQFPELDTLPQDSAITAAFLRLYAASGTNAMPMEVRRNTGAWDDATASWSTAPTYSATVWNSRVSAVPGWNEFDIRPLVRHFVRGELPNHGMRLLSAGAANQSVPFDSSYGTNPPELTVKYMPATRLGVSDLWEYVTQDHGGGNSSSVNLSTGNLVFTHDGGSIATRGFGVDLIHTYNSQDGYGLTDYYDRPGGYYGENWTFSQNLRIYERDAGRAVVFKDGSGGADRVYTKNTLQGTTQTYFRPLYYDMTLTEDVSATRDPARVYTLEPDSGGETLYFDGGGKLRRIEDRNGNFLSYAYDTDATNIADANGRLASITDVAGRRTLFEYNGPGAPGRLSKITDMAGRVSTYGYDGAGNLTTIKHWLNSTEALTTALEYGVANQLTGVTNPRGHRSSISNRVEYRWDTTTSGWVAEGATTTTGHDTTKAFRGGGSLKIDLSGVTDTVTGGASQTFTTPVSWNSIQDELWAAVLAPAGSQLNAGFVLTDSRDRTVYGPQWPLTAGQWTAIRMPDAHVDPAYKIKKIAVQLSAPAGAPAYTGPAWLDHLLVRGVITSLTDSKPAPSTTGKLDYNPDTRTTVVSEPDQNGVFRASRHVYDRDGQVLESTDPLGNTGTATYDGEMRLQSETDPDNRTSRLSYYPNSNEVRTVTSPAGEIGRRGVDLATGDERYVIDARNEKLRIETKEFAAVIYLRDGAGNVTSEQVNRYAAGADLEQDPFPAPLATLRKMDYTYGPGGVLTSMTDPNGNVTNYSWQAGTSYLTGIDSPAGTGETTRRTTTIVPNADGSPSQDVDPKGQKTTYEYDAVGDLVKINYGMQDGVADFSTSYTLDPNGNTTAMTDKAGSSSWTYDENDALTSESRTQNSVTKTAAYAYYANGLLKAQTTFEGKTVSFGYDAALRDISQTDPSDTDPNGTPRTINYAYDQLSRPTAVIFPSGVRKEATYDPGGRMTLLTLKNGAGTLLQSFKYDYGMVTNPDGAVSPGPNYWNGFVRSATELDGSVVSYGYDDLNHLVSATRTGANPYTESYTYDANDNRTSVTRDGVTTNAAYDAANQLIGQGVTSYSYDRNGNMTASSDGMSYTYNAANQTAGIQAADGASLTFGYDGEGQRVSRTVGNARTDYWYDQFGLTLETGETNAAYLRSPEEGLLSVSSGGSIHNYATNQQGSTTGLVTTGGTLVNTYDYKPYGEPNNDTGTAYNPYRYTGTYQDKATGLYQMGARYYKAESGRFTQLDPLPETDFHGQRYAYVGGNPINYIDPSGLCGGGGSKLRSGFYCFAGGGRINLSKSLGNAIRSLFGGVKRTVRGVSRRCSFSADTPVATKDGEKPISELEAGDEVLAYDETTGRTGNYTVAAVWSHMDETIEYLTIDDETIETTPEHPFYTSERGWVAAGNLRDGMQVRRADGSYGTVNAVRLLKRQQPMYNLTVERAHTYFVGDGQWLAHNHCGHGGGRITGYTSHGVDQAISRDGHGVATWAINDAVRNPVRVVQQSGGRVRYTGRSAVVVLNSAGKVVTTWARTRRAWRR